MVIDIDSKLGEARRFNQVVKDIIWGVSSAGRAPRLQRGGQGFDPPTLHHFYYKKGLWKIFTKTRTDKKI